jgi:hypothetical protein
VVGQTSKCYNAVGGESRAPDWKEVVAGGIVVEKQSVESSYRMYTLLVTNARLGFRFKVVV